jgi:glutathione S-transferase
VSLTLYEHPFALYCQKVIIALRERGLEFEMKVDDGQRLIPGDREGALQARFWDRFCDAYVSDSVQAIAKAYDMLEARLVESEWLAGSDFSIADCAAAPGLFYAWAVNPWNEQSYSGITAYYQRLSGRPAYAQVIEDARPYRHLFPLPWPEDIDRHHGG